MNEIYLTISKKINFCSRLEIKNEQMADEEPWTFHPYASPELQKYARSIQSTGLSQWKQRRHSLRFCNIF